MSYALEKSVNKVIWEYVLKFGLKRDFLTFDPLSKFHLFIFAFCFSFRAHAFFTWGPYAAFYGMALTWHIVGFMKIAIWTDLRMFQNFTSSCLMLNLLLPVLGGVDGNLHIPVPSMNRLNQTEPATFLISPCWAFFSPFYY
jgi:hypothetical protein